MFQSTHPVWDATARLVDRPAVQTVSIHASRVGCDQDVAVQYTRASAFQSTHPVWDATQQIINKHIQYYVSIHASRVGCDSDKTSINVEAYRFNPRIPCGMRRVQSQKTIVDITFQSTHPVWDATAWKLTVDGQWCSCRFAPTCLSCCYFQVRSFYSNDVNVLKSRLYENRRSAGNFL